MKGNDAVSLLWTCYAGVCQKAVTYRLRVHQQIEHLGYKCRARVGCTLFGIAWGWVLCNPTRLDVGPPKQLQPLHNLGWKQSRFLKIL